MSERKLELRDIAGYMPYGLKYFAKHTGKIMKWERFNSIPLFDDSLKPILRPLSDLYATVTHGGKKVMPIVECARAGTGFNNGWVAYSSCATNKCKTHGTDYSFYWSKVSRCFMFSSCGTSGVDLKQASNTVRIFDTLNELKIDYRGLIGAGLAVSVHDMKTEVYK